MTTLLLFPGAGSTSAHSSLVAIEQQLGPTRCVRADFPYRHRGQKMPDRAPVLMAAVRTEISQLPSDEPFVFGGRSMGGRMCSMIAAGADGFAPPALLRGLVLISYPLHPPGKPGRLRIEHLPAIKVPTLFISGTKDEFGSQAEMTEWSAMMAPEAQVEHQWLPGKRHDLRGADQEVAALVQDFLDRVLH